MLSPGALMGGASTASSADSLPAGELPYPTWPRWLTLGYAAFLLCIIAAAVIAAVGADRAGTEALSFLGPIVEALAARQRSLAHSYMPTRMILPVSAALLALWVAWTLWNTNRVGEETRRWGVSFALAEALLLATCTVVLVAFRFFALNHQPMSYVGEMTIQAVFSTDFASALRIAGGTAPMAPWAPIGLLHFAWMWLVWHMAGASILAMRLASVLASIALAQLLYWFGRRLGGPLVAILAMTFYATSPVGTVWGRNSMFPFDFPSLLVIGCAATTFLAIERRRAGYWMLTAVLMGASFHAFGSAYTGFLIPLGALAWLGVFHFSRFRSCLPAALLVLVGLALWAAGPSLSVVWGGGEWSWASPLDRRVNDRAFRGTGWGNAALAAIWTNLQSLYRGFYVGGFGDTHQTPIAPLAAPNAWLQPFVTALFSAGIVWLLARPRSSKTAVLLPTLVAAALPGIASWTTAHRETALFPAMCIVAALVAGSGLCALRDRFPMLGRALIALLPTIVIGLDFTRTGAYYLTRERGVPWPDRQAAAIREEARPGTLLFLELPETMRIDVKYLLYDEALGGEFAWRIISERDWPAIAHEPKLDFGQLYYRYTKLRHLAPQLSTEPWRRATYVIYQDFRPDEKVALLRSLHPELETREHTLRFQGHETTLTVASHPLRTDRGSAASEKP